MQTVACPLKSRTNTTVGTLTLRGEEVASCADVFHFKLSASKLVNKEGWFSTSDPFFVISRLREDGSYAAVWRSEHVSSNLNPRWSPASIEVLRLSNGDYDRYERCILT